MVELVQEVEHLAGERELDRGEVAERVDRAAGGPQAPEQRDILLDRSADGLDPPLVEQMQFAGEFRKGPGALRHRLREVGGDVGEGNEIHRQRGRQEPLHPRFVVHGLAEEVARIPTHEHVADVKDDDHQRLLAAGQAHMRRRRPKGKFARGRFLGVSGTEERLSIRSPPE